MDSSPTPSAAIHLTRYRWSLGLFIAGLVLSGVTAFPLLSELSWLCDRLGIGDSSRFAEHEGVRRWIAHVHFGLEQTYARFPFIGYGTDWLAFGHLVIALFFIEPFRRPLGNEWVLKTGLLACAGVVPLALICGAIRGIPMEWRLIDCAFGVLGALPLWYCLRCLKETRPRA